MTGMSQLRDFLTARDDADPAVGLGMRSILLEGDGDVAVLLLHGLTASPPAWTSIAGDLNAAGATVVSLRLPLHGHADRLSTALERLDAVALTDDLRSVIVAVAGLGKRIVVAGHSLGGTLALYAAATIPHIDRVVAIAPFLGIATLPHEFRALLIALINRLPNVFLWWDPVERERQQPAHGYPRYPLHALATGMQIAQVVYAGAKRPPQTRVIDLVINAQESSVNNRAVRRLAERWRAAPACVAIRRLEGLPPSHDIIEPARAYSARARATLVRLLLAETALEDTNYVI